MIKKTKTFTALYFKNNRAQVYAQACLNGEVIINHARYYDKIFILKAVNRYRGLRREDEIIDIHEDKYK
jgi:hypothetical protein